MGSMPASAANRLYRLAFSILPSVSPEYGEQIYTSGRYLAAFSFWTIFVMAS